MFHSSTQREHWTFKNEEELREIRKKTNGSFCSQQQEAGTSLLDAEEEFQLFRYYQKKLVELCNLFAPPKWVPLPRTALTTAVTYFKRFYLHTSVMEYHPQDMYFCCTFLAFKIDEYNITLEQFIETVSPYFPSEQLQHLSEFILGHELFLLEKLNFQLTVHAPFRPLSGFLVDMKTRSHELPDADQFRRIADKFLLLSLHSDVLLLFPPSQVALAALWHSAKQTQTHIEGYISSILLNSEPSSTVQSLTKCLDRIEALALATTLPDRTSISSLDEKLAHFTASANKNLRKRKSEEISAHGSESKKLKYSQAEKISGIALLLPS